MDGGIVSYGVYVPRYRIKIDEIAGVWNEDPESIKGGLRVKQKSVPDIDEDTATISVEAARNTLKRVEIDEKKIGAIYVGSESHPYAVKPTATIVAEAVDATPHLTAADYEFACKAGTAAIQNCLGLVRSGMAEYGLAIGSDVSQGAPSDQLEYTAGAGGGAYLIGKENLIAKINKTSSYTTDTPDFWRREGQRYPSHGGRFTGEPGYFEHVTGATEKLLEKTGNQPDDYDYAVFHQPNGKFPVRVAKRLGFNKKQYSPALVVNEIGNTYSGSTLIGLAMVLDQAEPGDRILTTSYGSGAGADSFDITVTENITDVQQKGPKVNDFLKEGIYLSYGEYAKHKGKVK
ncbi:3-hydroxy-3-methylglutaryl CoA synthase [Methanonatronarchaeum thermophilum]|uniref:Hydroxymethylglutaryl-CoA synthase n=1 Tax=Methanonatronarchaeum thermophilum TaxID=1927129 RepID=A0A1Y3GDA5_9EURY|nr:hydroxymethylglutaryl-CoA synthase [Methanonatronarchaeum thermophilum]OUJ19431.1 3-hydroxy-3-methylglutaryl CoA synthase [Methanonatronarchaeum thermophilum]